MAINETLDYQMLFWSECARLGIDAGLAQDLLYEATRDLERPDEYGEKDPDLAYAMASELAVHRLWDGWGR